MSQPAGTINDGNLAFGSQQITLTNPGGAPQAFIADNVDYEASVNVISRKNEFGVVVAETLINEPGTGSATLQVLSTTNVPTAGALVSRGATGTILDIDGVVTLPIKITKVGRKFTQDGETKISVEFRQRYS